MRLRSKDELESRKRWEQFIANRNLVGGHLIGNERLTDDLHSLVEWNAIPRYLLIDRNGKIVNDNATPPGDPGTARAIEALLDAR